MRPALKRISRGFHVQWEISWFLLFLLGQFHGFTYQLIAQFHGIPLEKSQPTERTFAGASDTIQANIWPGARTRETNLPPDSAALDKTPSLKWQDQR
jgi:hypothetical protein